MFCMFLGHDVHTADILFVHTETFVWSHLTHFVNFYQLEVSKSTTKMFSYKITKSDRFLSTAASFATRNKNTEN
jgi:hypothetical protein